jgi:diguanylate cyclase (GGDEF)-like protein/PAS domain S-box-containing protein
MAQKDKIKLMTLEIEKLSKIINELDLSEKEHSSMENALKESQEKYRELIESLPFGIIELNREGIIENVNKSAIKILGCSRVDLLKKHFTSVDAIEGGNLKSYFKLFDYAVNGEREIPGEVVFKDEEGNDIYVETRYNLVKKGSEVKNIQVLLDDITERKKVQEELEFLRFHDQLTRLFNRSYMDQEIKRLDVKRKLPISVIMGDINGLKLVNEAFGNEEGDRLLCMIADIFRKSCRKEDIIARYGEDEFMVLLPNTDEETASRVGKRVMELCKKISRDHFNFFMSLGQATKTEPEMEFNDVLTNAIDMLYRNKLTGGKSVPGNAVTALVDSLLGKGYETKEHVKRVEKMADDMAKAMQLPKSQTDELMLLASLHDLGKVAIPDEILKEKKKLTGEDWDIIKTYPEVGYNIAKQSFKFSHIADYILSHHERWDGSGYPRQLKGEDIPLVSRIMAIIDSYDVMRSGRFYKNTRGKQEAIKELRSCSGSQFDPELVEVFIGVIGEEG